MSDYYIKGDSVMIHSGKYTAYIASFIKLSDCGRFAIVDLDLSPESIVRRLRLKVENISEFK